MFLLRILQVSPLFIYVGAFSVYIITGKILPLLFMVGAFLLSSMFNPILKRFFEKYYKDVKIFQRPNPPAEGCGLFPDIDMPGSKTFGFPSGHAQLIAFAAMFWTLYLYDQNTILRIIPLWLLLIAVCWHRIYTGCHNFVQVFGGVVIGLFMGAIYYCLICKIDKMHLFSHHLT